MIGRQVRVTAEVLLLAAVLQVTALAAADPRAVLKAVVDSMRGVTMRGTVTLTPRLLA